MDRTEGQSLGLVIALGKQLIWLHLNTFFQVIIDIVIVIDD